MNGTIAITRRADGRLILKGAGEKGDDIPVTAACAFPWSHQRSFISIRDDKGHEKAFVEALDALPEDIRSLIEDELSVRNYIPRITEVHGIVSERELFHWTVDTDRGARSFLTNRHDHPRALDDARVLIKDIGGDVYLIDNINKLDKRSLKLLWVYLD